MTRPDWSERAATLIGLTMHECYDISKAHGFHTPDLDRVSEKIALAHSELSEALEADRKNLMSDKLPGRTGVAEELADAVIRIFDLAVMLHIPLEQVIFEKMEYNRDRPLMHGGKKY